jgi:3-oxoacyl-(acyl-carrier-protein) synthase
LSTRVYVAGIGVISAIGNSVSETLRAFEQQQTGIGKLTLFKTRHTLPVGEVNLSNQALTEQLGIQQNFNRTTLLAIHAARQAVADAGLKNKWRMGMASGTTVGGMDRTENVFRNPDWRNTNDYLLIKDHECGSVTERVADDLGISESVLTINTACSSSVNSIMYASRLIKAGKIDVAIAGGTDALTAFTMNGFNSLMILDKELCRPFDASRTGLNLGEGAGYVVLVSENVVQAESLTPYCEVTGYANTNDAFHQTASSPEGRGSFMAMQSALNMADLKPGDIDYINLHGTGTKNNDSSEGIAVQKVFGDVVPPASSTKAFTGHTLGASGGIEAVFSVLSIKHGCIYPNLRFAERMPEINFSPATEFVTGKNIRHVMSNSFGFGGNCSSIIFSKSV